MSERYQKMSVIGSGTFGRVWVARLLTTGRRYVVKEVAVTRMEDRDRRQALTEVEVLARCKHVNIIKYREAFIDGGFLNIVMAYADGGDLHVKILGQNGSYFAENIITDWFVQVCFALRYIHGLNILHRDLKTQNIFLTTDNIVKVGDFGISRMLEDTHAHAQTAVGTPFNLSPEICQQRPYNHKSDMWAAGCVLYELCTLSHPFDGSNLAALIVKILHGTYRPIASHYGPLLQDLVSVLLRGDAQARPSADQVLSAPAVQPYINAHVQRTASKVGTRRRPCVPATPPTGVEENSTIAVCPEVEKENINPSGETSRKYRRLSLATPKCDAMVTSNGGRQVCSVDATSRTGAEINKEKAAPVLSLYQEVLKKTAAGSPGGSLDPQRELKVLKPKGPSMRPRSSPSHGVCSKTYTIRRHTHSQPISDGDTPRTSSTSRNGAPKRDNKSRSDECDKNLPDKEPPLKTNIRKAREAKPKTVLADPSDDVGQHKILKPSKSPPHSSCKVRKTTSPDDMDPHGTDLVAKVTSQRAVVMETARDVTNRFPTVLWRAFCRSQDAVYQTIEVLLEELEKRLGFERLQEVLNTVRQSLAEKDDYVTFCARIDDDDVMTVMPEVLHLLQLEAFTVM